MTTAPSRLVTRHARLVNVLAWAKTVGMLCSGATAIYGLVTGNWIWAAVGLLSAVGTVSFGLLTWLAGVAVVISGAWPAGIGPFTAGAAIGLLRLVAYWSRPGPLDESALAEAVRRLPDEARDEAHAAGAQRVDTNVLLRAAMDADPYLWKGHRPALDGPVGSEGGMVRDTGWTVVAAEAALAVGCRSGSSSPPGIQHLATAAILLPHSAARAAFGNAEDALVAAEHVGGLSVDEIIEHVIEASRRPGGELLAARALLRDSGEHVLPEARWRVLRSRTDDSPDGKTHA
ncbi:hypothetical protein [Streptomyces sp. NPDC002845]